MENKESNEYKTSGIKQLAAAGQHANEEAYWLNQFSGEFEKTRFPGDFKTAAAKPCTIHTVEFSITHETFAKIIKIINQSDFRLFFFLTTVLVVLLNKYTSSKDIIVGAMVLKQNTDARYINTVLALRNRLDTIMSFKELLLQVRQTATEATENQNYPIETLVYQLNMSNDDADDFPLFDIAIILENIHDPQYLQRVHPRVIFSFKRSRDSLSGRVEYDAALYRETSIIRIIEHYKQVIREVLLNVNIMLADIGIVSPGEKKQLLYDFNRTDVRYPEDRVIHEIFEAQVQMCPGSMAVVCGDRQITYHELNARANQLAWRLKSRGIAPGVIAGIMIERSIDMVNSILGVLKAGGAYLPIDANYPEGRIRYMLRDSAVNILISRAGTAGGFNGEESLPPQEQGNTVPNRNNLGRPASAVDLIYVIYTSGSTGKPRGVLVDNRGILNLVHCYHQAFNQGKSSRMSQVASPGFDAMTFEIWPCFTFGATLHIADDETQIDPNRMKQWLIQHRVSLSYQPTIMAEMLLDEEWPQKGVALKLLLVAGDRLTRWPEKQYPFRLYNLYGPTEDSVWTTFSEVKPHSQSNRFPPIGKPIGNHRLYILDPDLNMNPIGVIGELCIGGVGLARGYINRPELTAEKFVELEVKVKEDIYRKSYMSDTSDIIYKTGDMARWLEDGNIEFIGRMDNQVKIRGFRIELGEIESCLLKHEGIKNAILVAREGEYNNKYLCAYITPKSPAKMNDNGSGTLSTPLLREYLARELPSYMIPAYFVELEEIPVTPNGKIDRKVLPEPKAASTVEYRAPTNDIEQTLAKIWQEVLGVKKVGIDDNFFNLGGDSIKSIQITAKLQKFKIEVKVRDLFSNPTIRGLGKCVKTLEQEIEQTTVTGDVELTPAHLWFLEHNPINMRPFNQSVMLYRKDGFDEMILEKVFTNLLEHHDALRMVFPVEGNNVIPKNKGIEGKLFDLEIFTLAGSEDIEAEIEQESRRIQQSIDVQKGPLVKLGLFKTAVGHHLLIAIHHFVVDGVSWRILFDDLATGFQQAEKGEPIEFQQKTHSFQYYAARLKKYAESETIKAELNYWKKLEETAVDRLHSSSSPPPGDNRKQMTMNKNREAVSMTLDEVETEKLLKKVNWAYNTEINDVLLTTLGLAVRNWLGVDQILVKLETHGREDILDNVNISRTVGWFTAEYPVLLDMSQSNDTGYRLKWVKETLRNVPNHGIGYGLLKYLGSHRQNEGLRFDIVPGIAFNYLGEFGQENANNNSKIKFSAIKVGDNISKGFKQEAAIEINGILVEGKLRLGFLYNKYRYEKSAIEKLVECYKDNLLEIVRHCLEKVEKGESEATPSDLVVEGTELSLEELAEIEDFAKMNLDMEE